MDVNDSPGGAVRKTGRMLCSGTAGPALRQQAEMRRGTLRCPVCFREFSAYQRDVVPRHFITPRPPVQAQEQREPERVHAN